MLLHYIVAMGVAVLAIFIAIILGDYGPWYLSWFLGTGFMVLVATAAGVLFEAQDDAARAAATETTDFGTSKDGVVNVVAGTLPPASGPRSMS